MGLAYLDSAEQSNPFYLLLSPHNLPHYFVGRGYCTLVIETLSHFHMFHYSETKGPSQTNLHLSGL